MIAAWLFAAWRGGARWLGVLWLAGLVGMSATLVELAREAGAGPLAAWERVASQSAFRFPAASSWVTTGQALGGAGARVPMVFAEEHRVTAPSGGRLRGRSVDGGRVTEREWTLAPGQSVTLRAGDRLDEGTALPLRFEAGQARAGRAGVGPGVVRVAARRGLAAARALRHAGGGWRGPAARGHATAHEPARRARGRRRPRGGLRVGAGLGDLRRARRARRVPRRRHHRAPRRSPDAEPRTAAMDGGAAGAAARRGPRELRRVQHRAARAAGGAGAGADGTRAPSPGIGVSGPR